MKDGPYRDIIDHPRHISPRRKRLSGPERAAQYLPYAALTGYDEVVREETRRTDRREEPDEQEAALIDRKLRYIRDHLDRRPMLTFTYFLADRKKEGGAYVTCQGVVKRVDEIEGKLILEDGTVIPVACIAGVEM